MTALQTCTGCLQSKPLEDFYFEKHRNRHKKRCQDCLSAYFKSAEYRAMSNANQARYRKEGRVKERDKRYAESSKARKPDQVSIRPIVRSALRSGKLVRPTICSECGIKPPPMRDGRSAIQGHHDDYSAPLSVRWLCHSCHVAVHRVLATTRK